MTTVGRACRDPYERSPYADADTTATMRRDADAAALQMSVLRPAPSSRFEPFETVAARPPQEPPFETVAARPPQEPPFATVASRPPQGPGEIRVSDAARRLATALHLHLD